MGGRRWTKNGQDRVYLGEDFLSNMGMSITRYKTGNISSAKIGTDDISNTQAKTILSQFEGSYINLNNGDVILKGKMQSDQHRDLMNKAESFIKKRRYNS